MLDYVKRMCVVFVFASILLSLLNFFVLLIEEPEFSYISTEVWVGKTTIIDGSLVRSILHE
ncbi:hypothetical protein [Geomicrobium sp. JCM 19039]|uniref:hypothetical protein n=1 Tax=Geomicrobium sp. JCM 19039 TaxID=1460636 RepID=UPI00045F222E|nr:hypothetical protein [Geomicrobium sp. JCM 19039]GAK12880.1 hypothetical protein JCM19039_2686 [Geomicrobium sp. JCM 19039]